jgi:hypothetical protein
MAIASFLPRNSYLPTAQVIGAATRKVRAVDTVACHKVNQPTLNNLSSTPDAPTLNSERPRASIRLSGYRKK